MANIFGVDTEKDYTAKDVRDAIVRCFFQAHCEDTGDEFQEQGVDEEYCKALVEKAFADAGGNFDEPTKEDLTIVINGLADFSKNFRDEELIKKHHAEISTLINGLK